MARGGIGSDTVSDPWKKSRSRMLNLSQVTSACATIFNLHCQIFHCHNNFCVCHPRPLFQPSTIVSFFIFLFILFCFANALFWVPHPALPLRSLSWCTFGLSMPCFFRMFLFFFGFYRFHSLSFFKPSTGCHVNAPWLDTELTPLDWMPTQHPLTTRHVDTPQPHATPTHLAMSLPGHAASMFLGFACPAPPPTSACGPVIAHWLAYLHVLGLDCRIRL